VGEAYPVATAPGSDFFFAIQVCNPLLESNYSDF